MVEMSVQPLERSRLEPHAEVVRKLAECGERNRPSPKRIYVDAGSPPAERAERAASVRARTTPPVSEQVQVRATSSPGRVDSVRARAMPPVSKVIPEPDVTALSVELVSMIMGRLSAQDIFGQVRRVDRTWRDAAKRVAPLTSYRRQVAEGMTRKAGGRSACASRPPVAGAATAAPERVLLPSVEWLRAINFDGCGGEQIMARLEGAMCWLDRQVREVEEGLFDDGVSDGGGHIDGREERAVGAQCRRLEAQLPGVRQLCVEKRLLPAATPSAASGETPPLETSTTRAFGVWASSADAEAASAAAAAAAAAASAAAASAAAQEAENRRRTTGEHRWDGWKVFALVVALVFSEDRPFLCRWVMQALGETGGLPRSQMIELLCRMHQALRPPDRVGTRPTRFQTASDVSSEWNGAGSYQLWADLRVCITAMEGCFLSLPRPTTTQSDEDRSLSQISASQDNRIDLSTFNAEQLAVVNTELDAGERLKVMAFAGTGKTHCLRAWAQEHPEYKRILLLSVST
ncbi:unnamed protein product [Laminaria digitata]